MAAGPLRHRLLQGPQPVTVMEGDALSPAHTQTHKHTPCVLVGLNLSHQPERIFFLSNFLPVIYYWSGMINVDNIPDSEWSLDQTVPSIWWNVGILIFDSSSLSFFLNIHFWWTGSEWDDIPYYVKSYLNEHPFTGQTLLERVAFSIVVCRRLLWTNTRPSVFPESAPPDNLPQAASAVMYMTDCPPPNEEKNNSQRLFVQAARYDLQLHIKIVMYKKPQLSFLDSSCWCSDNAGRF